MITPQPPTANTAADLAMRTAHRRAVEAVIWGIPAVNHDLMYQAHVRDVKGAINQISYWSRVPDWKNQTLTPNPDTIYFMPFFSTKEAGPVVLEIPPAGSGSITGTIMNCWQEALEDVGPAGMDQGKGGRYLITPPGFKDTVPDGYLHLPSNNYQGYALLRSILKSRSDDDIAKAVAYGFFESLHRMVHAEPWLERDRAMIDTLESIGIEQGKPFAPDQETTAIFASAAEARAWFDVRYETGYRPYNADSRWFFPADETYVKAVQTGFTQTEIHPLDARGTLYYFVFSSVKHPGAGQYYLFVTRDKDGQPLDGAATYRLHVPPHPPVRQYWSAVLADPAAMLTTSAG